MARILQLLDHCDETLALERSYGYAIVQSVDGRQVIVGGDSPVQLMHSYDEAHHAWQKMMESWNTAVGDICEKGPPSWLLAVKPPRLVKIAMTYLPDRREEADEWRQQQQQSRARGMKRVFTNPLFADADGVCKEHR